MKRKEPRRFWADANERFEIEAEQGCRVCGRFPVDRAHVVPREFDERRTGPRGGEYRYVHPLSIAPLCNIAAENHHGQFDRNELDISEYLTDAEIAHAVSVLGEGRAMRRITGDRDMLDAVYVGLERGA